MTANDKVDRFPGEGTHQIAPVKDSKTTITLTITDTDKRNVKIYAVKHKTTVSDLLHDWIQKYCDD